MSRKSLLVGMAVVLVLALVLGCAQPATTPAPAPAPSPTTAAPAPTTSAPATSALAPTTPKPTTPTATTEAPIKPVTIKYHDYGPKRVANSAIAWIADEMGRLTNGAVKFEYYWSAVLGTQGEQPENMRAGLFDMGPLSPAATPGKMPLAEINNLPGATDDPYANTAAYDTVYNTIPEFKAEYQKYNIREVITSSTTAYVMMSNKPLKTAADMKGLKIRVFGDQAKIASKLGAAPVGMAGAETLEAMQRNTIDAVWWVIGNLGTYGIYQASKYYYEPFGLGVGGYLFAMSEAKWNSLDPRVQKLFVDLAPKAGQYQIEQTIKEEQTWVDKFKAQGLQFNSFPSAEVENVRAACKAAIWDTWVADRTAKGLPAQKVLDAYLAAIKGFKK